MLPGIEPQAASGYVLRPAHYTWLRDGPPEAKPAGREPPLTAMCGLLRSPCIQRISGTSATAAIPWAQDLPAGRASEEAQPVISRPITDRGPLKRSHVAVVVLAIATAVGISVPTSVALAAPGPRTLTIQGSKSAETRIKIPGGSTFSSNGSFESDQVAITGGGRVAGVVLERLGRGPEAVLVALNYNACGTKGCKPVAVFQFVDGTSSGPPSHTGDKQIVLPAGTYRVVLVADGAPVKVRLDVAGLVESVTVQPGRESGTTFHKITDVTKTPVPAGFTYSGGRTYPATSGGAFVGFQELYRTNPGAAAVIGTCVIFGEAPPANAYAPGCPTGDRTSDRQQLIGVSSAPGVTESLTVGYGATGVLKDQVTSIGSYLVTAVPVLDSNVTQIEVPLNRPKEAADTTGSVGTPDQDGNVDRNVDRDVAEVRGVATVSPETQVASTGSTAQAPALPATGGTLLLPLFGVGLITLSSRLRRRR